MRRKILEDNYYIPYKLIKSLSTALPSNSSTTEGGGKRYEARIKKKTVIRIENDVLKRGRNDSILVNAAVIHAAPGKLIFILEPTRAEIMQRKFELNTKLKVYHNGNIFLEDEMTYSDKPFHPILHTSYLAPAYKADVTGFDRKMARHWKKPAWTPEEYAEHFANPLIAKVRDKDGFLPMILDNDEKAIPVTAKPFDGVDLNPWGTPSKYFDRSTSPMYVLLETRSYFERKYFDIEAGCVLRNDLRELVCTEVQ